MGWKDWPYWLKGGIILLILDVILLSFLLLITQGNLFTGDNTLFIAITQPILSWFTNLNESNPTLQAAVLVVLQGLIGYFIIGAIIGWVYGKIKNRNQNQLQ